MRLIPLLLLLFCAIGGTQSVFPTELWDYLAWQEGKVMWEVVSSQVWGPSRVTELRLVSQLWRGMAWQHRLLIGEPPTLEFADVMLLYIAGDPDVWDIPLVVAAAGEAGLRVAILSGVPNQPLFGRREDALIAYTFEQYAQSGEPDWPLLFPMVQSALAAMEVLPAWVRQERGQEVRGFVVAGASKRGWTAYLAAAARPELVVGLAPMVFEAVDIPAHLAHQKAFWGRTSTMIEDYAPLFGALATEAGARLAWIVDPYTYRFRLTMPKLIVLGTNDPYWPVNSANLYWEGLPGPKALVRLPNVGHGLGDWARVARILATFARLVARGLPLPQFSVQFEESPEGLKVFLQADPQPKSVRLWTAADPTRDFRKALWTFQEWDPQGGAAVVAHPGTGYRAVFVEVVFEVDGRDLALSSAVRILPGW